MKKNNARNLSTESNTENLIDYCNRECARINDYLAKVHRKAASEVISDNASQLRDLNKGIRAANVALANDYYTATPALEVLKNNDVPALALDYDKATSTYKIVTVKVAPTLIGMKDYLPKDIVEHVDAVRRMAAYIHMTDLGAADASIFLTGGKTVGKDGKEKTIDAPSAAARAYIKEGFGNSYVCKEFESVLKILTQGELETRVINPMMKDFGSNVVRRAGRGVRMMSSAEYACDCVVEYVWMLLNGKTTFTVKVKEGKK